MREKSWEVRENQAQAMPSLKGHGPAQQAELGAGTRVHPQLWTR